MSPRRIGFDAIRALRNSTGLGNYSRGVLRGLRQLDPSLDIHLYAPDPGRAEFRNLAGELGATVHLPLRRTNPMARALWRTFRLGRDARADGVQLYHGLTHEIPRDLPAAGIPSVVSFADLIYEKSPEYFPLVDRWSYRWRYRWSAQHATAVVAISAQTRNDLVERYRIDPLRIAVIPPARDLRFTAHVPAATVDTVRARYHLPAEYLLSIGTIEPRKNHAVLLAALSAYGADAPHLVLVGRDGGALVELRREIAERGLRERVSLLTDVATDDLPALLRGAAIFLYPSRVEGFGMPIVEALSAGTPVIASAGGVLEEAGGPGSRYVPPDDGAAWAAAIRETLHDSARRHEMSAQGRAFASRFDGDRLAARLVGVYDAVIAGNALPAALTAPEVGMERSR